jgi:hypothetical protein
MWRYTVTRPRTDGVTNTVYVEYFENYPLLTCNNINQLYAGDKYVDWVGFDLYSSYGSYANNNWDADVGRFYNLLTANSNSSYNYLSKPWMISELGISHFSLSDQEAWYSQAATDITNNTYPNLKAYVGYGDNNPSTGVAENRQGYNDAGQFVQAKQDAYNAIPDAIYAQQSTNLQGASTPSTITVTTPSTSATVSGTVAISGTKQNIASVKYAAFRIDNVFNQGSTAGSYNFKLDTTKLSNGKHTFFLRAWDAAGNSIDSKPITITIHN